MPNALLRFAASPPNEDGGSDLAKNGTITLILPRGFMNTGLIVGYDLANNHLRETIKLDAPPTT